MLYKPTRMKVTTTVQNKWHNSSRQLNMNFGKIKVNCIRLDDSRNVMYIQDALRQKAYIC